MGRVVKNVGGVVMGTCWWLLMLLGGTVSVVQRSCDANVQWHLTDPFILQAHAKKVEAVFEAARGGQYRHAGGVDVLLRAYSLPGTLHDHQGRSLLHYAAFVQLADGAPLWLAQDVRSLVESHGVLMNAVDFKGVCVCVCVCNSLSRSPAVHPASLFPTERAQSS